MLDNFICCNEFFKRVLDCKTSASGARSDHSAIKIKFKLTAIKLNLQRDALTVIDWEKIRIDPPTNKEFNDRLHLNLMQQDVYNFEPTDGEDYTTFNTLILQSAQATATKLKSEDKGWFHHSKGALLPAIVRRDQLLHSLQTASSHAVSGIKTALTAAQEIVTDTISLAKATWSAHLAEQVHAMRFTPKQA